MKRTLVYTCDQNADLDIHDEPDDGLVFINESIDCVLIRHRDIPWVIQTLQVISERDSPTNEAQQVRRIVDAITEIKREIATLFADVDGLVGHVGRIAVTQALYSYIRHAFPEVNHIHTTQQEDPKS